MNSPPQRSNAALSLDLDNLWSYLRAAGDPRWRSYPSFLPTAVPRLRALLGELGLTATVFVVGRDASAPADAEVLAGLLADGHETGNHSYSHPPDFQHLDEAQLDMELASTESALATLGASRVRGFRAPSFRASQRLIEALARRGYLYDSSTFPNAVGALARAWQRRRFGHSGIQAVELEGQYGTLTDALRPLSPYRWQVGGREVYEIPVSTMPVLRLPVHWTYLNFLAEISPGLALRWIDLHIALCRARRLAPVLLLHATDVIGADDPCCPTFMPGMRLTSADKAALLREGLARYCRHFALGSIASLIEGIPEYRALPLRAPERSRLS